MRITLRSRVSQLCRLCRRDGQVALPIGFPIHSHTEPWRQIQRQPAAVTASGMKQHHLMRRHQLYCHCPGLLSGSDGRDAAAQQQFICTSSWDSLCSFPPPVRPPRPSPNAETYPPQVPIKTQEKVLMCSSQNHRCRCRAHNPSSNPRVSVDFKQRPFSVRMGWLQSRSGKKQQPFVWSFQRKG